MHATNYRLTFSYFHNTILNPLATGNVHRRYMRQSVHVFVNETKDKSKLCFDQLETVRLQLTSVFSVNFAKGTRGQGINTC